MPGHFNGVRESPSAKNPKRACALERNRRKRTQRGVVEDGKKIVVGEKGEWKEKLTKSKSSGSWRILARARRDGVQQ